MKLPTALAAFFLFPALLLAAPLKTTDTVKLKNGTTLEGRMIEETSEAVVMEAMPGIMTRVGDRLCVHLKCTPDQRREMKAGMAAALPSL